MLVTGGAGFIGSCLVRQLLDETNHRVVVLDKLTYAGHRVTLRDVFDHERFVFQQGDIADRALVEQLLSRFQPSAIVHLAAESHVDRSIDGPAEFVQTNVVGTSQLLEAAWQYWRGLPEVERRDRFRWVQVSTDEVFGALGESGQFTSQSAYAPNSPYAASKAAADHFVRAYHQTFGLPTVITHCSNNYGPHQFPEKLIPLMVRRAVDGRPLPVYGSGRQVRDWLHVADHCRGLRRAVEAGKPGHRYLFGGRIERTNLELVEDICDLLDSLQPLPDGRARHELITFVADRPGHDFRYSIDPGPAERELGWRATVDYDAGLRETVRWYLEHASWCDQVLSSNYDGSRLGCRLADGSGHGSTDTETRN